MATYLVVAYQTANSRALLAGITSRGQLELDSGFVLLVPATPIEDLIRVSPEPNEDRIQVATRVANEAAELLRAQGLKIEGTIVGDSAPLTAIGDELRANPGKYDGIIISTFPTGMSHWLRQDLPAQVKKRFHIP